MRNRNRCLKLLIALCLVLCATRLSVLAQDTYLNSTGNPAFNTASYPVPQGFINTGNGDVSLTFPLGIGGYKTRGSLPAVGQVITYDSRIWRVNLTQSGEAWAPNNAPVGFGGWQLAGQTFNPQFETYTTNTTNQVSCGTQYSYFSAYDANLNLHHFPITTTHVLQGSSSSCTNIPTGSAYADDGSGYFAEVVNYTGLVMFDNAGDAVFPEAVDRNGNTQTLGSDSNITDSRGIEQSQVNINSNQVVFSVLTPGGSRVPYTATIIEIPVSTNFQENGVQDFSGGIAVIQSISLPDGSSYTFSYDSGTSPGHYGEMTGMTLPTGGQVSFGYGQFTDAFTNINHWLTSVQTPDGTTTFTPKVISACPIVVSPKPPPCIEQVTVAQPSTSSIIYQQTLNNGAWNTQTQYQDAGTSVRAIVSTSYDFSNICDAGTCTGSRYIHASTTTTALDTDTSSGVMSATETDYPFPQVGLPTSLKEWDYYTGAQPSTPTRQRNYTYNYFSGLVGGTPLVTEVDELDPTGALFAKTTYGYDEYPLTNPATGTSTEIISNPGNLTTESHVTNLAAGSTIATHYKYDDTGQLTTSVDGNNNQTAYSYDATNTFITGTTYPQLSSGKSLTTGAVFDYYTGSPLSATDQNGQQTGYKYDTLGRMQTLTHPDGGTVTYAYPSVNEVDATTAVEPGVTMATANIADSLGRAYQTSTSSASGTVTSTTTYDGNGRVLCKTVPESTNPFPTPSPTDNKDCYTYDVLNRIIQTTHSDGTKAGNGPSSNYTTTNDEDGGQSDYLYYYNAFNNVVQAFENPPGNSAYSWETDYTYDPSGHLTGVTQKNGSTDATQWRLRTFGYDAAGRKTSEVTPEAGKTTYTPDGNGNILSSTDARGVTVTNIYDSLNRATSSVSSDNSFSYAYSYDESGHGSSAGHLTTAQTLGTQAGYQLSYDMMGRTSSESYCLPSICYGPGVSAQYNYLGDLLALTYPDGRTVSWTHDSGDHVNSIANTAWNGTGVNFPILSNPSYAPPGQLTGATYGNGVQFAEPFTNRQVPNSLSYQTSSGTALWSAGYRFDSNAINLRQITNNVTGYARQFMYDFDNRVKNAVDVPVNVPGATPGQGTITISGNEQSTTFTPSSCPPAPSSCQQTVYEGGELTLLVNGQTAGSVDYGAGSTPNSLAVQWANSINNNANSQVTATANQNASGGSASIGLTTKTEGSASNYSVTVQSSYGPTGSTPPSFSSPAFQAEVSFTAGTGGAQNNLLNETYNYDPWGNLQQSGTYNFTDSSDSNNHVIDPLVQYDAAGNMLTDQLQNQYRYDGAGKLISGNGDTYIYDPSGNRIRKNASTSTEYIYFDGMLIAESVPATGAWTDYVYNSGKMLAEIPGSQTATPLYHLNDHLGSLIGLADSNQNFTGPNDFAPYGEALVQAASNPFLFTGLEHDSDTSSEHATFRNLSSTQGRWLRPDPSDQSYDLTHPESMNRYAYVNGQTGFYTDPSGLDDGEGESAPFPIGTLLGPLSFIFDQPANINLRRLMRRPNSPTADPWSETLGIPGTGPPLQNPGLAGALGLPTDSGCEFGACGGGGAGFQQSYTPGSNIYTPPTLYQSFLELIAGVDFTDPDGRLFGTHYCGVGGNGSTKSDLDEACAAHDKCYTKNHLTYGSNFDPLLNEASANALQGCNEALCSATSHMSTEGSGAVKRFFSYGGGGFFDCH